MKIEVLKKMMPGIYEEAKKRGFYDNDPSDAQMLMSAIVEMAELAQAFRCMERADRSEYGEEITFKCRRDGVSVKVADGKKLYNQIVKDAYKQFIA